MPSRSAVLAAFVGALTLLLAWLAVSVPLALRLMHIAPVAAPPGPPPPPPAHNPARRTAAVLLSQAGTEVTDFLAPFAILAVSGAFNVYAVAPGAAPAPTNGGLGIVPHLTLAQFDTAHPHGADLVVIPNVLDPDNPALLAWLRAQAQRGAVAASICEGARLLAATGLLDGHSATTHFAALADLRAAHPRTRWRDDVRWVDDGAVVSSAGVTAAIDTGLHLVTRFAGDAVAARSAATLGLPAPAAAAAEPGHLAPRPLLAGVLNGAFLWPKQAFAVPLADGIDELAIAAPLDAWPRTFAARTATTTAERRIVRSRHGLWLVPSQAAGEAAGAPLPLAAVGGATAFDAVLGAVAARFGTASAELVALQLQYPAAPPAGASTFAPRALGTLAVLLALGAGLGLLVRARWRRG